MKKNISINFLIILLVGSIFLPSSMTAQQIGKINKWLNIGELHNWYSSVGAEREEDGFEVMQQSGFRWPGIYLNQDMQCAKGIWIGCKNYEEQNGAFFNYKVNHCGPRPQAGEGEFFPIKFDRYVKHQMPLVFVDDAPTFKAKLNVDVVDPELPYDQMLYNVVNTQMGLTMERKIFQFGSEYHNNYIVTEYTFINTGNCDDDEEIERTSGKLEEVYFYYQYRLAVCRETRTLIGNGTGWGQNTLNHDIGTFEKPRTKDWIKEGDNYPYRYSFAWHGYYKEFSEYNNVGGPIFHPYDGWGNLIDAADAVGRLGASQFPSVITVYADDSENYGQDDVSQPSTTGVYSNNGQWNYASNAFNEGEMQARYNMMKAGHPDQSQADRINGMGIENYASSTNYPGTGSKGDEGYSLVNGYGPYNIEYGDTVKLIIVEAASGLSRDEAIRVGKLFKDGKISDVEKNRIVMTGIDSLHQTVKRVINDFNNGWKVPEPPLPPKMFSVTSSGGFIKLSWLPADGATAKKYEVYRTVTNDSLGYAPYKYYGAYKKIAEIDAASSNEFIDSTGLAYNVPYYYYIQAVGEEVAGKPELGIPSHELKSSRYYTQTYAPAYLIKPGLPDIDADKIRVVPNPYISKVNDNLPYITFENLSELCTIKIYTELGELIKTIEHTNHGNAENWFLRTSSNQYVVSGVYIAVITDSISGKKAIVKFAVIR